MAMSEDPGAAALLTLAEHAQRLNDLQDHVDVLATARARDAARLRAMVASRRRPPARVDVVARKTIRRRRRGNPAPAGHQPITAARWWALDGDERQKAISRLRTWVKEVYRPSYGQLADALPPCWPQHPLALATLDWLSELHTGLYEPPRTMALLASQAEWQLRLMPAAIDQIGRETRGCGHDRDRGAR